ncbi:ankyrin repeat and MYND domain-containing protein 1-like isoform X1 [Haliotis rufescens]|uniref:ankyrin repeat and MYND domain-containing protein 1-like isoform X1 n=1 Tax=Haliotis rufescens TaxID=6454 RepID=UPI00201F4791|nr:ankyrin repeat and MYND domain-containing protein 1-like isoform X1 [Haliotis rufescens]
MSSIGQTDTLLRLNTATTFEGETDATSEEVQVSYKTGATFQGKVQDHKKVGRGVFTWPNGEKYDGQFSDNLRHGKGVQYWSDGSCYDGVFVHDLRHGQGYIEWANKESYKGTFFKDRRHGKGLYTWPNGSSFQGTFYMDKKEGYGTFHFTNGDKFEGLYINDEREGPGVTTYKDGTQDVGLWFGEKLIKLCSSVPDAFTLKDHQEFDFNPEEHVLYIDPHERSNSHAPFNSVLNPPSAFDYTPDNSVTDRVSEIFNTSLDPRSLAINKDLFDEEFYKDAEADNSSDVQVVAWNKTPSMINLQRHVHKHKASASQLSFSVQKIIDGDRSSFKSKGRLELASEELLGAAMSGDMEKVEELLINRGVHPDVADKHCHTALIGATVNWHIDIINLLLNHGADVNKLNDEGCSALSAGTIFFYPIETFHYNIAERYLEKPPEVNEDATKDEQKPKGILSKKMVEPKISQNNELNREKSQTDKLIDQYGVSSTSIDSGIPPMESMQSLREPGDKSLVTIADSAEDTRLGEDGELCEEELKDEVKDADRDSVIDSDNEGGDQLDDEIPEDFDSNKSVRNYQIEVTEQLVERCATQLSTNDRVVSRHSLQSAGLGTARMMALQISLKERMKETLDLLLRRGADPNASGVPMPVLFFAIKAADVEMVKVLLMKGASTEARLPKEKGSLAPLHIACAIPGEEGVQITELLLNALADPDVRAEEDDSFLNKILEEEWSKDVLSEESKALLGGRTPLQIACARDDNYKHVCRVARLLLEHKANPSLLCNGFSALALAITSGNDHAIDELLLYGADPSLTLTHGVGSALCVATSTEHEHRRTINGRLQLVDKLIRAGANILAPIPIGPKRIQGTAVDYAYYMFHQDRRIAHMPYHALTHAERETYNARKKLLAHVGDIMRGKAVERERRRLEEEFREGQRSSSPSAGFVYVGAGAPLPPGLKSKTASKVGQVTFDRSVTDLKSGVVHQESEMSIGLRSKSGVSTVFVSETHQELKRLSRSRGRSQSRSPVRKPLLKYCYECGRSVGVRLSACTRCKEVYYCSKACKLKAWNARHRDECIRVGGRSRSPSPSQKRNRVDSPTPTTTAERGRRTTVNELTKDKHAQKVVVPIHGQSHSAKGPRLYPGGSMYNKRVVKSGNKRDTSPGRDQSGAFIDNYSFV